MRGKILLVISLYVLLGLLVFFNFGVYRHVIKDSWGGRPGKTFQDNPSEDPAKNVFSKHSEASE